MRNPLSSESTVNMTICVSAKVEGSPRPSSSCLPEEMVRTLCTTGWSTATKRGRGFNAVIGRMGL